MHRFDVAFVIVLFRRPCQKRVSIFLGKPLLGQCREVEAVTTVSSSKMHNQCGGDGSTSCRMESLVEVLAKPYRDFGRDRPLASCDLNDDQDLFFKSKGVDCDLVLPAGLFIGNM